MPSVASERVHVDRHRELGSFRTMLSDEGQAHILLLKAGRGMGKSSLLIEFASQCPDTPVALVDLKPTYVTPESILDELATQLGRSRFPTYEARSLEYVAQTPINFINNDLQGGSSINAEGPSRAVIEQRRLILTNEFMRDLESSNASAARAVLMFDTYELGGPDVQAWLSGPFITRVRGFRWLILVVAGREIPPLRNDWRTWLLSHDIEALDCDSIREYVARKGVTLDEGKIEFLCGIGGNPLLIETNVEAWALEQTKA